MFILTVLFWPCATVFFLFWMPLGGKSAYRSRIYTMFLIIFNIPSYLCYVLQSYTARRNRKWFIRELYDPRSTMWSTDLDNFINRQHWYYDCIVDNTILDHLANSVADKIADNLAESLTQHLSQIEDFIKEFYS